MTENLKLDELYLKDEGFQALLNSEFYLTTSP